jgi:hypothetical protein
MHPWSLVQTQQTTLGGSPSHPAVTVRTSVEQGEMHHWPADALQRAHSAMTVAAAGGKPANDPRDLVNIPITRTHAWNFLTAGSARTVSRPRSSSTMAPTTSSDHVEYLSFRPSPGILTAGWAHPVLKK